MKSFGDFLKKHYLATICKLGQSFMYSMDYSSIIKEVERATGLTRLWLLACDENKHGSPPIRVNDAIGTAYKKYEPILSTDGPKKLLEEEEYVQMRLDRISKGLDGLDSTINHILSKFGSPPYTIPSVPLWIEDEHDQQGWLILKSNEITERRRIYRIWSALSELRTVFKGRLIALRLLLKEYDLDESDPVVTIEPERKKAGRPPLEPDQMLDVFRGLLAFTDDEARCRFPFQATDEEGRPSLLNFMKKYIAKDKQETIKWRIARSFEYARKKGIGLPEKLWTQTEPYFTNRELLSQARNTLENESKFRNKGLGIYP